MLLPVRCYRVMSGVLRRFIVPPVDSGAAIQNPGPRTWRMERAGGYDGWVARTFRARGCDTAACRGSRVAHPKESACRRFRC
jgi:hypothetical protein